MTSAAVSTVVSAIRTPFAGLCYYTTGEAEVSLDVGQPPLSSAPKDVVRDDLDAGKGKIDLLQYPLSIFSQVRGLSDNDE